jgi:hypothetical protein
MQEQKPTGSRPLIDEFLRAESYVHVHIVGTHTAHFPC